MVAMMRFSPVARVATGLSALSRSIWCLIFCHTHIQRLGLPDHQDIHIITSGEIAAVDMSCQLLHLTACCHTHTQGLVAVDRDNTHVVTYTETAAV